MAGTGVAPECAFDILFHSIPFIIVYVSAISMQKKIYFFPENAVTKAMEQLLHLPLFILQQIHKPATILSK